MNPKNDMKHTNEAKSKPHKNVTTHTQDTTEQQEVPQVEQGAEDVQPPCSELETAQQTLEAVQAKYDQLNDSYLRLMAEYDNYRKRTLKEKAELIKSGGESVLINILSVVDDMERGIKASAEATDINAIKEGMELIHSKFAAFLKQQGIAAIETEGQSFDTDHHEAIATVPAPDEALKGKVLDCVQKGYFLHDKVIRFAKVVVGE
ncbi:MAG: heat shock protein GrpE [Bacteroidetes bacterium ADurb.Bin416]|jgi:molecular chaperone GrpE|nr:MAG: heat shock protein GrpE [Bacteroidetes bacterium ADurb.Bin416]